MSEMTEVIERIQTQFVAKAGQVTGLEGTIEFNFTGIDADTYVFTVADGALTVEQGQSSNFPDLTVSVSQDDFVALANGELNAMQALMTGKIKLKGDMGLAMRLQSLLSR